MLPHRGDSPVSYTHTEASLCQEITALIGLGSAPMLQGTRREKGAGGKV